MTHDTMVAATKTLSSLMIFAAFFLFSLLVQVRGQDATAPTLAPSTVDPRTIAPTAEGTGWTGCVDPFVGPLPVTIGSPTTVCLVLSSSPDWATSLTYMRLHFQPTADVYSRFHVPRSYFQLVKAPETGASSGVQTTFTGNITVHASSQTALSFQKLYFDGSDKVYPYLTAVIDVQNGNVTGISWDDACAFCGPEECKLNTYDFAGNLATEADAGQKVGGCYLTEDECDQAVAEGRSDCDLLLYVVWTGTDSNGKDFKSSAYRFSAFPEKSWVDRINLNVPQINFPDVGGLIGGDGDGDGTAGESGDGTAGETGGTRRLQRLESELSSATRDL